MATGVKHECYSSFSSHIRSIYNWIFYLRRSLFTHYDLGLKTEENLLYLYWKAALLNRWYTAGKDITQTKANADVSPLIDIQIILKLIHTIYMTCDTKLYRVPYKYDLNKFRVYNIYRAKTCKIVWPDIWYYLIFWKTENWGYDPKTASLSMSFISAYSSKHFIW